MNKLIITENIQTNVQRIESMRFILTWRVYTSRVGSCYEQLQRGYGQCFKGKCWNYTLMLQLTSITHNRQLPREATKFTAIRLAISKGKHLCRVSIEHYQL
jgi:hypothetical protein